MAQQEEHRGVITVDVLEGIDANVIASINHDDECYFCKKQQQANEEENVLEDDPDEDADDDGPVEEPLKFKNDAGKLGVALRAVPDNKKISVWGGSKLVSYAAHHLIPGNAALKNSQLFKSNKYLWKNGRAKGNIGYNINSSPNGLWLPGNYAVRPWSPKPELKKEEYAHEAIKNCKRQFHDAHEEYSTFVKEALNKIFDKLEDKETLWCPEAQKKAKPSPEERGNLYAIVMRLHTISGRCRRMLKFPAKNWRRNVYTSRFSRSYMTGA